MASIVLAGGQSRRMGRDKALLVLNGETLVARAVRVAGVAARPVYLVADRADRYTLPGVVALEDERPGCGPLAGIVTGLRRAGEGRHVVLACDMPKIDVELLQLLLCRAVAFDGAVPWIQGRPEPLCAVYSHRCLAPFSQALEEGHRAVHRALHHVNLARVTEEEIREIDPQLDSLINLNDVEQWRRFQLDEGSFQTDA